MFGESLSIVRDIVEYMKPKLDKVCDDAEILKSVVRSHGEDLRTIKSDVASVKSDVAEIKADLKTYSARLELVEAKLPS